MGLATKHFDVEHLSRNVWNFRKNRIKNSLGEKSSRDTFEDWEIGINVFLEDSGAEASGRLQGASEGFLNAPSISIS